MSRHAAPDFTAIVVGAGQSTRFGGAVPKQFLDVGGCSVLERSVRAVAQRPAVGGVIVVLAPAEVDGSRGRSVARWPGVQSIVAGGGTRADSVARGVEAAGKAEFVLIHDAARPFAPASLVDSVIEATRLHGAAVPLLAVPDTVKSVEGDWITGTVSREALRLAQTPQGARTEWLRSALRRAADQGVVVTDEASALERDGCRVAAVPGDAANRKITTVQDLEEARLRAAEVGAGLRVGTGYDVHRFEGGRLLVLGGVRFEGVPGLAGHSDADVVLHAAMDALLGAAGLGDIGKHFPPEEERFAGADSTGLARQVAGMLEESGWRIVNLDLTVLAEAPKIRGRDAEMREVIAGCLGTVAARVSLKATTLEGLGALGRREGIACQAVALLARRAG